MAYSIELSVNMDWQRGTVLGKNYSRFCEFNQLTTLNTCFQKKSIHLGTWVHPATKLCHMINIVVMRNSQRKCCLDVQVMCGANIVIW